MKLKLLRDDTRGAVMVEFSVTIGFFLVLTWGLIAAGLLLWTYAGLQHGVEVATRCASVNYSAYSQFTAPLNTSCFTDPVSGHPTPSEVIADNTNTYIRKYAAQNSFGLVPSYTSFAVTLTKPAGGGVACSTNVGYHVTATYTFNVINYIFSPTITASSNFPINCS